MTAQPTPTTSDAEHVKYMRKALDEARKSAPVETAFCVGAVIVSSPSHPTYPSAVLSMGFSRELPGNTHAEQCALDKLLSPSSTDQTQFASPAISGDDRLELLDGASIYTTMEPCSTRLSGNVPCVQRILKTGIKKVYMGVEEPKDFVECEGTRLLREAGREVFVVVDPQDPSLGEECLRVARRRE
ncbi:Bifunctional protein RIB2 [Rhodotorula toruloides]|uniref:Diaminohydroxyphosphoribosylamino-pyrimidine deaminase n=1 Tax=Rhodotorula toruloides TaxID=5286 RepID=A0A0K3CHL2_RHOTO|nr:Bifunctional protein RIB2 [Rhodotorula toruloides]PRQ73939.1 diaminohydroxyphosphoribosylamino-pyrimidine deaminase [Rhodotorula toruloides]